MNKSWKTKYITAFMLVILFSSLAFPTIFTGIAKASSYPAPTVWSEPSARVNGPVNKITFHFSDWMDTSSFSIADDIVTFYDPNGNQISVNSFDWVTQIIGYSGAPPNQITRYGSDTLEVYFPSQSETGTYTMVLGPHITSLWSKEEMDQQYWAKFIIAPPIPTIYFDSSSVSKAQVNSPASLTVRVTDQYSLPIANSMVTFWSSDDLHLSYPTRATTDSNGYVTINAVSGTAGQYTIYASTLPQGAPSSAKTQYTFTIYDVLPKVHFVSSSSAVRVAPNTLTILWVQVTDQYGVAVKNTWVNFSSSPAGLSLASNGTTDANGYRGVDAVSGTPGIYTVQAIIGNGDIDSWILTVYTQIPSITLVNSQSSVAVFVPASLTVQVIDQYNVPIKNAVVSFASSPSGLTMPSSGVTDSSGYVTIQASSETPGTYSVQANIGSSLLNWDVTVEPPKVSFDGSSVPATATNVPASLTVQVIDQYNVPIKNAVVSFASSPSGLTMPSSGVTDSSGYVTIQASSETPGTYSVQANIGGITVQWTLTVYNAIPTVSFDGNSPSAVAAYVPANLGVYVIDQYGFAVNNAVVTFSSSPAGLSLPSSGTTDVNGYLSVSAVSGTPGTYTVTVSSSESIAQFTLTIITPVVSFDSNSESSVRAFSSASLSVGVTDQDGNPIPDSPVKFSSTPAGLFLPTTATTDYTGHVQIVAYSKTVGVYTVQASVDGVSTQFTLQVFDPSWRDDFNYQTTQQMIDSDWLPYGPSTAFIVGDGFLTMTNYGSSYDVSAQFDNSYNQIDVSAPYRIETKAMILDATPNDPDTYGTLDSSVGPALWFATQSGDSYVWTVNYFDNSFMFFKDDVLVWSGSGFNPSQNTWSVLAVETRGNSFYLFCNNNLEGFYVDPQGTQGSLTSVLLLNNRASVEYDYVQVTCDTQGHDPISVDGDSQFTLANGVTSGTGTETDPYVIENLVIGTSTPGESGIALMNTNAYFVIKNCNIINTVNNPYSTGITLDESNNGEITNTSITQQYCGIAADGSNLKVDNSIISNNFVGVDLSYGFDLMGRPNLGSLEMHFCNIFGNSWFGLLNYNGTTVNAINNWWGSPGGPFIKYSDSNVIPWGMGDSILGIWNGEQVEPWLTAPLSASSTQKGTDENIAFPESDVTTIVSGSAEINVATYASPPTAGLTDSIDKYVDVYIPDTSSLNAITIQVHYTLPLPNGISEDALVLRWYDSSQGKWVDCSESHVNTAEQYVYAVITATSTPNLSDFGGTTFGIAPDSLPPTTSLTIGEPKLTQGATYITPSTQFTLQATDEGGSGVAVTYYRILDNNHDSRWLTYSGPFSLGNLAEGSCTVEYKSIDNAGNEESQHVIAVTVSYPVTFTQNGLPTGTTWSMTLGGTTQSSTTSTITFTFITTGSYTWIASNQISKGTGTRYVTSTASGTINVPIQTAQSITYAPQYQVTFALNPTGTGTINPTNTNFYDSGSKVSLSATAKTGYTFWQWTSNNPSITFANSSAASSPATINGPGTITATFATLVSGNKNIALTGSNNIVVVAGGNNNIDCTQATSTTIVKTGSGNNIITFGSGDNIFKATASGNDIITTGNGNNNINIVGNGNNQITTGNGNDQIQITGNGNNIINAGSGNNIVTVTGTGNNQITTGSGDDVVTVGGGNNVINAGDGKNQVTAGNGNNQIATGIGNDVVVAGNGNNSIQTGAGDDSITVGSGNNNIDGGSGYDTCVHGAGKNTILNCEKK